MNKRETKEWLENTTMPWHVKEEIEKIISIYEARINSLQQQVDALLSELRKGGEQDDK